MSPAVEKKPTDSEFAQSAIPLLKEYAEKLRGWLHDALGVLPKDMMQASLAPEYVKAVRDELTHRLNYIHRPAEELARQVSAVVDQGRVKGLEKVELWLRLAEFESALQGATQTIETLQRVTKKWAG